MKRRDFLKLLCAGATSIGGAEALANDGAHNSARQQDTDQKPGDSGLITLFLCGDVMTGRGIDQALPHPADPRICESYVQDAVEYVRIAEWANGPIAAPVTFAYIWGDALAVWEHTDPDVRIINLETAVTTSEDCWLGKGINYRMNPQNVPCLTAAGIDCCVLANNHVIDWGYSGLTETLHTLSAAAFQTCGAGDDVAAARAPAVIDVPDKGRVIVLSMGLESSGIPPAWAATEHKAGVHLLPDLSERSVQALASQIDTIKRSGDVIVASIHWGGNWGYRIPRAHRDFAHRLIDSAQVDIVHGHSSHHPLGIEVYRGRPIVYGCGDFLNDYEGIGGYEEYRPGLSVMYFPTFDSAAGTLRRFELVPLKISRFRLNSVSANEAAWLRDRLDRESRIFGARVIRDADNRFRVVWD